MEILENEKFGGKRKIVIIERRDKERFTRMKRKHKHRLISKNQTRKIKERRTKNQKNPKKRSYLLEVAR